MINSVFESIIQVYWTSHDRTAFVIGNKEICWLMLMYFRLCGTRGKMKIIFRIFWNSDFRQPWFPRKPWPWCRFVAHYSSPVQEVWICKSIHSETLHIGRRAGINGENLHSKHFFNCSFAMGKLNIEIEWTKSTKQLNSTYETVEGPPFSLLSKNHTKLMHLYSNILGICSSCVFNLDRI